MNWKEIPSLPALRAFEAAVRCKSLSQAARELNVTHAAIAQHVRGLEADIGETLLLRDGRGVAPTEAGRTLADTLNTGFSTIIDGVNVLRAQAINRPLQITATPAFTTHWLMPRIGEFWAKHPEIEVNINPSVTLVDLRADGFDLALRYGDGSWAGLDAEMLTEGTFWGVAHPDLVAGRVTRSIHDLTDLPWLLDGHVMERKMIIEREGIDLSTLKLTILMTNEMVMSAAVSGLGVTFQPRSIVERELASGQLVKVCELSEDDMGYYMVSVPARSTPHLNTFKKWLRSKARTA